MTEKFFRAGIRVPRVVAIIALEEIIDITGERISLERALGGPRQRSLIRPTTRPVLEIRAFGTKSRLQDVSGGESYEETDKNAERRRLFLEDARQLVAQELGKSLKEFGWEKYFEWLAGNRRPKCRLDA